MSNSGIYPPDLLTDVGLVRVLLGDDNAINLDEEYGEYAWFGDDEIQAILGLYQSSPRRAAARLLFTVAASQALLLKRWSADDLAVQGDAIAESLRRIAKDLLTEDETATSTTDIFEVGYPGTRNRCCHPEAGPFEFSCNLCEIC